MLSDVVLVFFYDMCDSQYYCSEYSKKEICLLSTSLVYLKDGGEREHTRR